MRKLSMLGFAAVMLTACGSGDAPPTVVPPVAKDTVVTIFANRQQWFTNTDLPEPITARVHLSSGEALAGLPVRVYKGADVVALGTTDANGLVTVLWKLGPQPGGQGLDVQVGTSAPLINAITADAVSRDSADVVIVHGVSQGEFHLVDFDRTQRRAFRNIWPDTVRLYLPRSGGVLAEELAALAPGHPPISFSAPWTARPDTIHVYFGPPIAIPITLWFLTDSASTVFRTIGELGSINSLLGETIVGVRTGKVTIRNAASAVSPLGCDGPFPGETQGEINVYYLRLGIASLPVGGGIACTRSRVVLTPLVQSVFPPLLAHEIGHTLTWLHSIDPKNLMATNAVGSQITIGQALAAHFWGSSSLNEVYKLNRPGVRSCTEPHLRCMEPEWDGK